MTDAPPLADRSAGMPPITETDFGAFYVAHRVRSFRQEAAQKPACMADLFMRQGLAERIASAPFSE